LSATTSSGSGSAPAKTAASASATGINAKAFLLNYDPEAVVFSTMVRAFITESARGGKALQMNAYAN
jgi:hypothetical protein